MDEYRFGRRRRAHVGAVIAAACVVAVAGCGGGVASPAAAPSAAAATGTLEKRADPPAATSSVAPPPVASVDPSTVKPEVEPERSAEPEPPQSPLAAAFPLATDPRCAVSDDLRTSAGTRPVDAVRCDFSATAPGAVVLFTRWSDAAGAGEWLRDTQTLGPRIEPYETWSVNQIPEGTLWTAQQPGQQVISTGVYDAAPYSWEIRAATLDDVNRIGPLLPLRPGAALTGGS